MEIDINTKEAKILCTIRRTLNITKAAQELGMARTTMLSSLANLETKLGGTLFTRVKGSGVMELSTFGHEVIHYFETIVDTAYNIKNAAPTWGKSKTEGRISIMSTQTILECFIVPYLRDFLDAHPNIRVELRQKDENYYSDPKLNEIFIGAKDSSQKQYEFIPYHSFTQKLWAAPSYIEKYGEINTLQDLANHRIIWLTSLNENEKIAGPEKVFKELRDNNIKYQLIKVAGPATCKAAMEAGLGITVSAEETIKLGKLNFYKLLPEISSDTVNIYVKADKKFLESALARYCINWIFKWRDQAFKNIDINPVFVYRPFMR